MYKLKILKMVKPFVGFLATKIFALFLYLKSKMKKLVREEEAILDATTKKEEQAALVKHEQEMFMYTERMTASRDKLVNNLKTIKATKQLKLNQLNNMGL